MSNFEDRRNEAKSIPIMEVASKLSIEGLKRAGREFVGPCPVCVGHDRFSINPDKGIFNCRHCGGGDVIKLVEIVEGIDFNKALTFLVGDMVSGISEAEKSERARKYKAQEEERNRAANRYRIQAINDAKRIWSIAEPDNLSEALEYLRIRGLTLEKLPRCFRVIKRYRYMHGQPGKMTCLHEGPVMVTAIQRPDGQLTGVHMTYLDLKREDGKALILDTEGKKLPAKKVRGSKKGGAIRLSGGLRSSTLIMGEGIETTLTAQDCEAYLGAMYWAGVDLGNMSGRMKRVTGEKWSGIPDLSDTDAFIAPPWVSRLIYIQDGDSAAKMTRMKLECGLKRQMAHSETIRCGIVHPGKGQDLNDLLNADETDNGETHYD